MAETYIERSNESKRLKGEMMDGVVTNILHVAEPVIIAIILGEDGKEYMYSAASLYELQENSKVTFREDTSAMGTIRSNLNSDLLKLATGSFKLRPVAVDVRKK